MFTWIRNLFNRHGSHANSPGEPTTKESQSSSNSSPSAEKPSEKCSHQVVDSVPKSEPTKTTETREGTVNSAVVDEHGTVKPLLKMTPVVQEVSQKTQVTPITSGPEITMESAKVGLISLSDEKLTDEFEVVASVRQATAPADLVPTCDVDQEANKVESPNVNMANDEHVIATNDKTEDVKEEKEEAEESEQEQLVVEEKAEQIQHKLDVDRGEENEELHKQEETVKAERSEDENVEDKGTFGDEIKEQEENEKEQVEHRTERVEHGEDHVEENEDETKASEKENSPGTEKELGQENVEEKKECVDTQADPIRTNEETERMTVHTEEVVVSETEQNSLENDIRTGDVSVPVQEISSSSLTTSEIVGGLDQI